MKSSWFVSCVNFLKYLWNTFTITLKARKLFGENGFQIYFNNEKGSGRNRWDIGDYNNTINKLQTGIYKLWY